MKREYNFKNAKTNPYAVHLRKQISIRLPVNTIEFFKKKAQETNIPYQKLMDMYLSDCATQGLKPSIKWK